MRRLRGQSACLDRAVPAGQGDQIAAASMGIARRPGKRRQMRSSEILSRVATTGHAENDLTRGTASRAAEFHTPASVHSDRGRRGRLRPPACRGLARFTTLVRADLAERAEDILSAELGQIRLGLEGREEWQVPPLVGVLCHRPRISSRAGRSSALGS